MTLNEEIAAIVTQIVEEIKDEDWFIPRDTGNMEFNALKVKVEGRYVIVYFDTKVAPYIPYTNEPWLSARWHGKRNPNQDWWDSFAQEFIRRLTLRLKGVNR